MGMAEQLLFGAASGLAAEGFTPFATTYAVFASRRAYDFIHQTIAEEDRNVKIVCALPGLTSGYGPSHQATEDLALFRAMPNMTVIDPCDALETEQATHAIAAHKGPVYMRLLRGQVPLVLDEYGYTFELGRAKLIRDGAEVLVISSGILTMRALEAAKELAKDKIGVAVLHVPTIKPLDTATIIDAVPQTRAFGRRRGEPHRHRRLGRSRCGNADARPCPSGLRAYRPARRVPRCRRPADTARPIRHLNHGHRGQNQGCTRVTGRRADKSHHRL